MSVQELETPDTVDEKQAGYSTRTGYKQTEVGLIPEDWQVELLSSLADRIMVGIASAATHAYRDRGVLMFRNQNIKPNALDDSDVLFLDPLYEETFRNKRLKPGDLLTARTGYPGTTCIVPVQYEGAQSFTTLITRLHKSAVNPRYLCFFINSEAGQKFFDENQTGGGQKNVNAGLLKLFPVPLPPLAEQEAIAEALGDADALVESLERLLAKKRNLKQAAMQQLLTGKKRLPGFEGEWETKQLGDFGNFLKGSGVKKDDAKSGHLPCVRYGEIYTVHNDCVRQFSSFISPDVAETATRLHKGDLLFAGSGETRDEIGKCVAFTHDYEAYAGGDIVILRTKSDDAMFFGYYLNSEPIRSQKASKGQAKGKAMPSSTSEPMLLVPSSVLFPIARSVWPSPPSSLTWTRRLPRSRQKSTRPARSKPA